MSAKNRDNKNRWRNITVGFRVSPEENELINKAVALSGLPKQEYCYGKIEKFCRRPRSLYPACTPHKETDGG